MLDESEVAWDVSDEEEPFSPTDEEDVFSEVLLLLPEEAVSPELEEADPEEIVFSSELPVASLDADPSLEPLFDDVAPSELDVEAVSPDGEESLLLVPVFPDEAVSDLLLSDVGSPASEVRGFPSWAELLSPELPPFTASMALSFLLLSSPPFLPQRKL